MTKVKTDRLNEYQKEALKSVYDGEMYRSQIALRELEERDYVYLSPAGYSTTDKGKDALKVIGYA